MCHICGQPACFNPDNCISAQPFCDQCAEDSRCFQKVDSQCVIYHFNTDTPTKLINLGFPNGANLEAILEKIDSLIGTQFNIPFTPEDTITIHWNPGGTAGHSPSADVKLSDQSGNTLVALDDGLFAPGFNLDYKVKVDASDIPDYLQNQIVGGTDGIISNTVVNNNGILEIIPQISILCLLNAIRKDFQKEFCDLVDSCKCLLPIENLTAILAPACPNGYVFDGTNCVQDLSIPATSGNTTFSLQAETNAVWSKAGALIFNTGFNLNGSGPGATYTGDIVANTITQTYTPDVWLNGTSTPFGGGNTTSLGPMNRCGIWTNPYNADTTFIIPINVPSTKTYYIGLGADNTASIAITAPNGNKTTLLTQNTATAGAYYLGSGTWNFDFWNIYPVTLSAGLNFLEVAGHDSGAAFGFGVEIYDNTVAELVAAQLDPTYISNPVTFPFGQNHYSNLNLIFSSRCARQAGTISANSATCPDNTYTLDPTTGITPVPPCQGINNPVSNWTCRKVITTAFSGYTVSLVWDRIPGALNYTVQQKLSTDPDSAWIDSVTSPVVNPGSGTTVSTVITGLTQSNYDFRVRANFDTCSTDYSVVTTNQTCQPVQFTDTPLPAGIVGQPYSVSIPVTGTPVYTITGVTKPSWMTIIAGPNSIDIGGTPDAPGTNIPVSFTINNCSGDTAVYSHTFDVTATSVNPSPLNGTFSFVCDNNNSGCAQGDYRMQFNLTAPLQTPLTIQVAARQLLTGPNTYYKYGYTLIPVGVTGIDYKSGVATVTIPAGVTTYTSQILTFADANGGKALACFNPCSGIYGTIKVTDVYMKPLAPDASLVLNFTNPISVNNFGATFTQVP